MATHARATLATAALIVATAALIVATAVGAGSQTPLKRFRFRPITPISGKAQFEGYFCVNCHGADGKGHGPDSSGLALPVADLTTICARSDGRFHVATVSAAVTRWDRVSMDKMVAGYASEVMPLYGPLFFKFYPDITERNMHMAQLMSYVKSLQEKDTCR